MHTHLPGQQTPFSEGRNVVINSRANRNINAAQEGRGAGLHPKATLTSRRVHFSRQRGCRDVFNLSSVILADMTIWLPDHLTDLAMYLMGMRPCLNQSYYLSPCISSALSTLTRECVFVREHEITKCQCCNFPYVDN